MSTISSDKLNVREILDQSMDKIMSSGPDRVVINATGEAVSPARAACDHDCLPLVIFIRKDGWSLGAPLRFAAVAEALWMDAWVGIWRYPAHDPRPYLRAAKN